MTVRERETTAEHTSAGGAGGELVYGVVRAGASTAGAPPGFGGAPVRAVAHGDVAALVTRVGAGELRATRRDLVSHSAVLEHVLADGPVLPLRFGTVLRDERAVVTELLEPYADELEALLSRFEGLVELRVKAFSVEEAVLQEVVRSNPAIARLRESVRALPEAASYPQRLRLGEAVARAVEAARAADADAILARLRPLCEDFVAEAELPSGVVLAASFLVARRRVDGFDGALNELAESYDGRIRFKYLGPLPPHSFVSLPGAP
jgi:hypothetical protein